MPSEQFEIVEANLGNLDSIVELHTRCFTVEDHLGLLFGKAFVTDFYRWLISSPDTCVLAALRNSGVVGMTSFSERGYDGAMMRVCKWSLLRAVWLRPTILANRRLWHRIIGSMLPPLRNINASNSSCAQIALTAVHPGARGQGIATALKSSAIEIAKARGCTCLVTGVRRENAAIRRVNERLGFSYMNDHGRSELVHMRLSIRSESTELADNDKELGSVP